jgi:hypothetical protein
MNGTTRWRAMLALMASTAALMMALPSASSASAAVPTLQVPAQTVDPAHGVHHASHAIEHHKATAADVASGFAASTAATVYTCEGSSVLTNPYTGASSSFLGGAFGWQESIDQAGNPQARINASTSVVFHNYANAGTTAIQFHDAAWTSTSAGEFASTVAKNPSSGYNTVKGQQQLGITILANGHPDTTKPNASTWYDSYFRTWGWRTFLAYNPNVRPAAIPALWFGLAPAPGSTTGHYISSQIRILADGNCGGWYLV